MRNASAADRASLQRFVCATPERSTYDRYRGDWHPARWALQIQGHFRRLTPPVPKGEALILSCDAQGEIRAACHIGFSRQMDSVLISAIGVSVSEQGSGLGLRILLEAVRQVREAWPTKPVLALIHRENVPAQRLCVKAGFEMISKGAREDHDIWGLPPAR